MKRRAFFSLLPIGALAAAVEAAVPFPKKRPKYEITAMYEGSTCAMMAIIEDSSGPVTYWTSIRTHWQQRELADRMRGLLISGSEAVCDDRIDGGNRFPVDWAVKRGPSGGRIGPYWVPPQAFIS